MQELELIAQSEKDLENCTASLLKISVYPVRVAEDQENSCVSQNSNECYMSFTKRD